MAIISTNAVDVSIQAVLPASIAGGSATTAAAVSVATTSGAVGGILGVGQAGKAAKCQQEEKDPNEVRRSHACIPQL